MDCFVALLLAMTVSSPVKHHAGDDEHRAYRQHLRKRFRGRPLGGCFHACLPRLEPLGLLLGMTHRGARRASDGQILYSEHPSTRFACSSPHSANIDRLKVEQYYGGNLARVQPDCAGEKELFARGNWSVDPPQGAGHDPPVKNQKTKVRNGPHRLQRSRQTQ